MLFLLMIWLGSIDQLTIDLDSVEMYESKPTIYHLANGHFLLNAHAESYMVVVNAQGEKTARYDKQGQGPNELFWPTVISVTPGRILVVSNGNRILAFDEQLKPAEKEFGRLSPKLAAQVFSTGVAISEKEIYLICSGLSMATSNLVYKAALKDNRLILKDQYIQQVDLSKTGPTHGLPPVARNYSMRYHAGSFIKFRHCLFVEEDYYEVTIYNKHLDRGIEVDLILRAPADNVEKINHHERLYPVTICKLNGGYVVTFMSGPEKTYSHDYFDEKGAWVKRVPGNYRFMASYNSDHVFKYDLDQETLTLQ
ncbi:MAG: hypothetical protein QNK37_19575 [Acidobacteriota bacterium]|nr:hypothetical protein [Acidobacteriota bacterium]